MKRALRVMAAIAAVAWALSGCANAHELGDAGDAESGHDSGMPRVDTGGDPDAAPGVDGGLEAGRDTGLAPACSLPAPRCQRLVRSGRASDGSASAAREVYVPALVASGDALQVLTEVDDATADRIELAAHRFDRSLAPQAPTTLDSMDPPYLGAAGATGMAALFAWNASIPVTRGDPNVELRWCTVDETGTASAPRTIARMWSDSQIGPVIVQGAAPLALTAGRDAIDVVDLASGAMTTLPIGEAPWDSIAAAPSPDDPRNFVVMWHVVDAEGFARAMLMTAGIDGPRTGPVTVLERLSTRASLLVTHDAILVAGFERTTSLAESRLRIARLDPGGLDRLGQDASFSGWGGSLPAAFELASWREQVWLVWLTSDPRFGASAVVFVEPLERMACAATVDEPTIVSAAPFDWTRRAAAYQMAVLATDDDLYIAHPIGDAGLFDIHEVGYECP